MSSKNSRELITNHLAVLLKTMGHEHRLNLLEILCQGEWTVEELAKRSGLSIANASQHLLQIKSVGLSQTRRDGRYIYYRLSDDSIVNILGSLRNLAYENIAEVKSAISEMATQYDDLEPISLEEALNRCADKNLIFIDVRDFAEFKQGHIANAIHIPLDQLETMLPSLPVNHEIIIYCRSSNCILSYRAVQLLRRHGIPCRRLSNGFPEWRVAGGEFRALS